MTAHRFLSPLTLMTALLASAPTWADEPPQKGEAAKKDAAPPGMAPGDTLRVTIYGNGTGARIRGHAQTTGRPLFNEDLKPKPVAIPEGNDVIGVTYKDAQDVFTRADKVHKEWTSEQRIAHELAYVAAWMTCGTLGNRLEADARRRAEVYAAARQESLRPLVKEIQPLIVGTSPGPRYFTINLQVDEPDEHQVSVIVEIVKPNGRVVGAGGLNLTKGHPDGEVYVPIEAR